MKKNNKLAKVQLVGVVVLAVIGAFLCIGMSFLNMLLGDAGIATAYMIFGAIFAIVAAPTIGVLQAEYNVAKWPGRRR